MATETQRHRVSRTVIVSAGNDVIVRWDAASSVEQATIEPAECSSLALAFSVPLCLCGQPLWLRRQAARGPKELSSSLSVTH